MSPRLLFAYLTLSLLEPLLALAKPPDLPVDVQNYYQNVVRERRTQGPTPRPSPLLPPVTYVTPEQVQESRGDAQEAQEMPDGECPCLDASCLELVEVLDEIIQTLAGGRAEQPATTESEVLEVMPREAVGQSEPEKLSLSPRHRQARHLFRIAERCRLRGDLDMARNCYEEVCRIAPKSPYGLLASGQLLRMKEPQTILQTGGSEAQEPPLAGPQNDEEEQALIEELNRLADQLRKQSHAEPECPFRRGESNPAPDSPRKPKDEQSMSDSEMQDMLEDAQFLETFLDDLVVPEGDAGDSPISRPDELTVVPAPRDLTIAEEPQRTTDQPSGRGHRGVKQRFPSPRVNTPVRVKP